MAQEELLSIDLGKVAICPKGAYAATATYERLDVVSANNSSYVSLKNGNTNHALTDTAWWLCLVDGSDAKKQAENALLQANNAHTMAERAEANAKSAQEAAEEARQAAQRVNEVSDEATKASESVNNALDLLLEKYGIFIIPTGLTVKAAKKISSGNKAPVYIEAKLEPEEALPNIIFISDNKSLSVTQDGRLSVIGTGISTIQVIPTMNTGLTQVVQIEVIEPTLRLVNTRQQLRLTASGDLRLN